MALLSMAVWVPLLIFSVGTFSLTVPLVDSTILVDRGAAEVSENSTMRRWAVIYSCILTIALCAHTAVRLNVPASRDGSLRRGLRKVKWIVLAIWFPEYLVFYAWRQWYCARLLCTALKDAAKASSNGEASPFRDKGEFSGDAEKLSTSELSFSVKYAFYIIMGGLALDVSDVHGCSDRLILTPKSVLSMTESGLLQHPVISDQDIKDKSKEAWIVKILAFILTLSIAIWCISQQAAGRPVLRAEMFTIFHAGCALLMYLLWLNKPLDIRKPTLIQLPNSFQKGAVLVPVKHPGEKLFFEDQRDRSWIKNALRTAGINKTYELQCHLKPDSDSTELARMTSPEDGKNGELFPGAVKPTSRNHCCAGSPNSNEVRPPDLPESDKELETYKNSHAANMRPSTTIPMCETPRSNMAIQTENQHHGQAVEFDQAGLLSKPGVKWISRSTHPDRTFSYPVNVAITLRHRCSNWDFRDTEFLWSGKDAGAVSSIPALVMVACAVALATSDYFVCNFPWNYTFSVLGIDRDLWQISGWAQAGICLLFIPFLVGIYDLPGSKLINFLTFDTEDVGGDDTAEFPSQNRSGINYFSMPQPFWNIKSDRRVVGWLYSVLWGLCCCVIFTIRATSWFVTYSCFGFFISLYPLSRGFIVVQACISFKHA